MANKQNSNIPVVILAGGKGSRIMEYTKATPKPLIRVNRIPILIRLIDHYIYYGFKDFIIATGYLHNKVDNFFSERYTKKNNKYNYINDVNIKLVNTGLNTMTGGRVLRLKKKLIKKNNLFCLTYGDGVSDLNLDKLIDFHNHHKKIASITTVRPPARFGYLKIKKDQVLEFGEKKNVDAGWINGGFFVFNNKIFNFIKNDSTFLEREPLESLAKKNELFAFKHYGFWQCMDTLRDKIFLDNHYKNKI
tara:strand:- start:2641 stop:3384 length:744 start_codon:yes stop_codon:yes gene_type:complete